MLRAKKKGGGGLWRLLWWKMVSLVGEWVGDGAKSSALGLNGPP